MFLDRLNELAKQKTYMKIRRQVLEKKGYRTDHNAAIVASAIHIAKYSKKRGIYIIYQSKKKG